MSKVTVVGAGLAGSEAAWQIAQAGVRVVLYEMRPQKMTPAHHSSCFSELVCSNSLRAKSLENAAGLLKEEMRLFNSLIMQSADANAVPAGGALAVDREGFSHTITEAIKNHPLIQIISEEVTEIPKEGIVIVATGPLTSQSMSEAILSKIGVDYCYFYDAAAPIVTAESLDTSKVFRASRYGKGDQDYLNCPMDKESYELFWNELVNAETAPTKDFEKMVCFEGCMPVEVMAQRGIDTLRFGPLKPVGLIDPNTGKVPYAVVQLRQDNAAATLYNIVGFQTHLKWPEQSRVFSLIPGLEHAEFVRYGVMHRNTYINSPNALKPTMQSKDHANIFFAGQLTGVEGYIESAAAGLVAGHNAARIAKNLSPVVFPVETAHGALCHYITHAAAKNFQPMNINFGLLPPLEMRIKDKRQKNQLISNRAMEALREFKEKCDNSIA